LNGTTLLDGNTYPLSNATYELGSSNMGFKSMYTTNINSNVFFGASPSNNVGVGTSNPQYKLHVDGTIFAQKDILTSSDERLKTDFKVLDSALDKVCQLTGYTFMRKDEDSAKRYVGMIAQDVHKVLPEAVNIDHNGFFSVSYGNVVALLVEAIKELKQKLV
jgi:hypothetical protein